MRIITAIFLTALFAVPVHAAGETVPRSEGFLLLWNSIRRPAEDVRETPFTDVPEGSDGFREIRYAKNRGILDDDDERFRPSDPLTLDDAILWLLRTRNVAELDDMQREHLPVLLEQYPLADATRLSIPVSRDQLAALMQRLDSLLAAEVHEVSLYGEEFHGDGTAFGESFDMHALTAAHRSYPHNTLVRVTNVDNDQQVTVRINDRGPYVEGRDMDLSVAAFTAIAERSKGVIRARFERLGDATLVDQCAPQGIRYQQRLTRDVRLDRGIPQQWSANKELVLRANKAIVIRMVRYPDGTAVRMQDFIHPGEEYRFTPGLSGDYQFVIGTAQGRRRAFRMRVTECRGAAE